MEALKKRKHVQVEANNGEPSTKRSKTVKSPKKEKKREKGKVRPDSSQFKVFQANLTLSIPPVFANDLTAGAEEMLDSMVMRYIPALQGVVLAHSHLQFLESAATIKADCPFANINVGFETTVWSPQIGMKLSGNVNLCSPDHISLLVHRTFNVSIPRRHIPTESWEFEYGPAENDPEFGASAMEGDEVAQGDNPSDNPAIEGSGRWVHKLTGTVLGGESGNLEFTVIGLTIANQMLSLVGSLQLEPFPIEAEYRQIHVTATSSQRHLLLGSSVDNGGVEAILEEDQPSDSDEEPFDTLSRMANKAVVEDTERKTRDASGTKAEKKRKRKEGVSTSDSTEKKLKI